MNKQKSWKRFFLGGVAATAVVASVAAFTLTPNIVSAQDAAPDSTVTEDGGRWFGGRGHGRSAGMMGHGMKDAGHGEHLAEALGITVDELEAAQTEAKDAAIAQLVEEGIITQEQADQMAEGEGRFGGRRSAARGHFSAGSDVVDRDALLADALGITVDELQAAKDAAHEAGLADAIEQGYVTEEQAEQMRAMHALHDYIDHEAIVADVLGLSVEELQEARKAGGVRELFEELGLDRDAVKEAMQAAFEEAVAQAVEQGVISQEQADALQNGEGLFPGRGGRGGHGFPGMRPGGFERGNGEDGTSADPVQRSRA